MNYNGYNYYNGDVKILEIIERKVTKIGNSIGITLPPELLKNVELAQGDNVQIELKDGKIILQKREQIRLPDGNKIWLLGRIPFKTGRDI